MTQDVCPPEDLIALTEMITVDADQATTRVTKLLAAYATDPRLHFIKGSLAAAVRDYEGAREAMAYAVDLAPDFAIARFQLGFLEFTSGNPHGASVTWAPLLALGDEHPLSLFVVGMERLARDEFDLAVSALQQGMRASEENEALNRNMAMLVEAIEARTPGDTTAVSSAHFLLLQYGFKGLKH